MKKIDQGKFEIYTTKEDAIDKFLQMQGVCREEISDEYYIWFNCNTKGKIQIFHPGSRRNHDHTSTKLYAEVIEQDGKTYISYYTTYSKVINIVNAVSIVIYMLFILYGVLLAIADANKLYYIFLFVLCFLLLGYRLFGNAKEKKNSPKDSKIMIKELEKRVEAINLWDK